MSEPNWRGASDTEGRRRSAPEASERRRAGLFAYGTLQFPEVLEALLDRVPEHRRAQAPGWRAARLRGLTYPGLAPGGGPAAGVLLAGLTADEWRIFDAFEDAEYDLVRIELADGVPALAYHYTRMDLIMAQDWSARDFASRHLPTFARQCHYWRMTQFRMFHQDSTLQKN